MSTPPDLSPLTLEDFTDVYRDLFSIRPKWYNFGLALNLPLDGLDCIRIKYREDPSDCLREVIKARLKLEHKLTWRDIFIALRESIVGESVLADKIGTKLGCEPSCSPEPPASKRQRISDGEQSLVAGPCQSVLVASSLCMVRYSSYLKDRYKQMSVLPDPDWPPAITTEQHYTNLALIERERHGLPRAETSETMAYDYAHGKIDNIVARKQEIKLEEAFLPIIGPGSKESRLTILMDGAPGVGKTTISRKVCIDWANGELATSRVPASDLSPIEGGHSYANWTSVHS